MDNIDIILKAAEVAAILMIGAGGTYYLIAKKKIGEFRKLVDAVDDAVYDDKVTEEEFRKMYQSAKALINGA